MMMMMMMMTMTIMMMSQRRRRQRQDLLTIYHNSVSYIYPCIYLSIYLSNYLSISIYPYIHVSTVYHRPTNFAETTELLFSRPYPSHPSHPFLCSVRAVVLLVISRRELPDIVSYSHQMIKPTMVASPSSLLIYSHYLMISVVMSMIILIMKESDVFQDLLGIWLWDYKASDDES